MRLKSTKQSATSFFCIVDNFPFIYYFHLTLSSENQQTNRKKQQQKKQRNKKQAPSSENHALREQRVVKSSKTDVNKKWIDLKEVSTVHWTSSFIDKLDVYHWKEFFFSLDRMLPQNNDKSRSIGKSK